MSAFEARKKLERLQDEFIALISHELLSPIGTIKGYTTTLLRDEVNLKSDEFNEFLKIINDEADRLRDLINVLLDSSRLQIGTLSMEFQPIDICSIIRDAVERVKSRIEEIDIQIIGCKDVGEICADPNRLAQVLDNVLINASKYAPGSSIILNCFTLDKNVHIEISDNGPGIPEESLELVFNRFYRVPSQGMNQTPGAGLGLYICRQIIEAHKGKIYAEAASGIGTTIKIILPIKI